MARKEKKYHYIYKTTNVLSGKYYIGMHSTNKLDDGYLGSGTRLRRSIRKYGKENFVREIIEYCETREELKSREEEIVSLNEIAKVDCMNLKVGGQGGFRDEAHRIKCSEAGRKAFKEKMDNDILFRNKMVKHKCDGLEKARKEGKVISKGDKNPYHSFKGKNHSDETKLKISESKKGQGHGKRNSQYGTMWITNEVENKKIKKGEDIPNGWRKGRFKPSTIDKNILHIIKEKYESGISYSDLSKSFNIPRNTIRDNLNKL